MQARRPHVYNRRPQVSRMNRKMDVHDWKKQKAAIINELDAKWTQLRPRGTVSCSLLLAFCCSFLVACFSLVASCNSLLGVLCSFRCRWWFLCLVAAGAFFIYFVAAGPSFVSLSQVFLLYRCRGCPCLFRTRGRLLFSRLLSDSRHHRRISCRRA